MQRAEVYQAMSRSDEALQDYDRAIALADRNPAAYFARAGLQHARRDYLKARDDYAKVIELTPPKAPATVNAYRNRAVINWLYLKEFDDAVKDWKQLIQLEPKNPDPHRYIGTIHLGRREYPEALDSFQKALALKPDYVDVIWARAQIHFWQARPKQALAELDPVIAMLPPDKPHTLNIRGDVYRALSELEKAAADYTRLIELRPNDHNAYIGLALVYEKQGKPEDAKACYDKLVAADPTSALAYLRRAEFYRDHGQFDLALADCDKAAGLDSQSALPELVRASIDAARGRYRTAVERAEAALKKAPPHDGRVLYAAACIWSLASGAAASSGPESEALAKEYADRAVGLLDATLDKGFHDLTFPEHNRMGSDPALSAIRSHPRVRELLAGRP
jgi:tetratricopeptide (TPR) repeat protein